MTGFEHQSHEFRVVTEWDGGVPVARLTSCGCGWLGGCSDMSRSGFSRSRQQWVRHVAEEATAPFGRPDYREVFSTRVTWRL